MRPGPSKVGRVERGRYGLGPARQKAHVIVLPERGCDLGTARSLGDRQANFGGSLIVPYGQTRPPFWRENRAFNQTVFSQFHMKPEFLKYYIDRLNQEPFDYFSGYPSTIYLLAHFMEETGMRLTCRPKAVFVGAESLLDFQNDLITKHIGKPTDHYGAAEHAAAASKCRNDYYHFDMELGVLEVIPLEGLSPSPGEVVGKTVVTGFHNPVMPLIRYELGDVVTLSPEFNCPCGRQTPVLKRIEGRIESYVITPDGRRVGMMVQTFYGLNWIKESQVIQDEKNALTIKLVPSPKPTKKDLAELMQRCRERLGAEMHIHLEFVDKIPRSKTGKFRAVISSVDTVGPELQQK